ncbi:hypothetical protein V6N11_058743 [Hibiscus sabdariffa]|uniref:Uncharacterized protein n=1 Tax=Hibiscus sabdariffa TaxID=183260 RepID=A0ABR2U5F0_9ROSI
MQSDIVRKEDDISNMVFTGANEITLGSCSITKSINVLYIEPESSKEKDDINYVEYLSSLGSMGQLQKEIQPNDQTESEEKHDNGSATSKSYECETGRMADDLDKDHPRTT